MTERLHLPLSYNLVKRLYNYGWCSSLNFSHFSLVYRSQGEAKVSLAQQEREKMCHNLQPGFRRFSSIAQAPQMD
ncbi:hypothetical protein M8J75_015423 [Diaphorina citri]|nr:hypothetical protein M8J75_015423 [Diaphorina citri]